MRASKLFVRKEIEMLDLMVIFYVNLVLLYGFFMGIVFNKSWSLGDGQQW